MVWALLVIPLVVALLVGYAITRSKVGQEAALRNLLSTTWFLVSIFALICALLFLPQPWRDYALSGLFIAFSIIPWLIILNWPRRKKRAGYLLWKLGWPSTHRYLFVTSGIFLINAVVQTILFVDLVRKGFSESSNSPEYYISQVILYWSMAISFLWMGFSKLELRENGIYFKFGLIEWKQIASYKWEGVKGNTLTLWIKHPLPFFQTRSWQIPVGHKNPVERIIIQHMPHKDKVET
jgi:uncharacterized membrane protein YhaH (DUF805 family)